MAINRGIRLGAYEIRSAIGAGGMGEVYQASDTKLGRDVAIKVLPDTFARDPERLARFQREAKMLAALNHPNIAAIYGLEEEGGRHFLVMELVPGATLEDRVSKEGALPLEEALGIARQIAEALEAAHEKNIIHRDLKPANVKITPEGKVKVLDFGLAKAYESDPEGADLANSPTLTRAATIQGIILGTAAYMSPEQARGKQVDKRTDIWAFGVVLYELLTGKRLFAGEDITETLASVVKDQPDLTRVPAPVRRLLERCLEKNPKKRLRDIGDAELLLAAGGAPPAEKAGAPSWVSAKLAWAAAIFFLVTTVAVGVVHLREKPPAAPARIRFDVTPPENGTVDFLALSPDGSKLAMSVEGADGQNAAWIRSLDSIQARKLPGTEGASALTWSPDSRHLAFDAGGKLKKVDAAGGAPETICNYQAPFYGMAWSRQDVIVFSAGYLLYRVNASGGEVLPLTRLDTKRQDVGHGGAAFLPDAQHFLYLRVANPENTGIYVGSIDAKPDQQDGRRLTESDSVALYDEGAGGGPGNMLFLRGDTLMARPFDARRMQFTGDAVRVADVVGTGAAYLGLFSVSGNGILATSSGSGQKRQLGWYDRQGKLLSRVGVADARDEMNMSPDGTRVAEGRADTQGIWAVWVMDLARGASSRFTFDTNGAGNAIWSPDGKQIVYAAGGGRSSDLFRRSSDGANKEEVLFHSDGLKNPLDWSPDGRSLLYGERGNGTGRDLWVLPDANGPAGMERKAVPYLVTPFNEQQAKFSPDGKWVAYTSNESGAYEVYVRPFPSSSGGKWLVSNGGGAEPRWRADGKELFFAAPDGTLMSVDVRTAGSTFQSGVPKILFHSQILGGMGSGPTSAWRFDVSKDGQRFLINAASEEKNLTPITVTTQWQDLLKK